MDFPSHSRMPDNDLSADPAVKKEMPKELTSHGTTPSGKPRLYVCSICTRAFARMEHLHRHERSHTKEKPFTCGVCQRKFSRRDLLLRHAQKLHAGCSDAITRLRRKLLKSTNLLTPTTIPESDYDPKAFLLKDLNNEDSTSLDLKNLKMNYNPEYQPPTPKTNPLSNSQLSFQESIDFKIDSLSSKESGKIASLTPQKMSRSSSLIKDQNLQRQIFDRRKLSRNRAASFSAQSGPNYAKAMVDIQDSYPGDNVEFSTPQLIPSSSIDEHSWIDNLSTIPGMSLNGKSGSIKQDFSFLTDVANPTSSSNNGNIDKHFFRITKSDSLVSSNSLESSSAYPSLMTHVDSLNKQTGSAGETTKIGSNDEGYGYTLYDIPESMTSGKVPYHPLIRPLSPIKQEIEDELMDMEHPNALNASQYPAAITEGVNFDLNFLNDMDELTQDFDVGAKFQPSGYSFYGDNPLVSSSGIESGSPPPFMSPSSMHNGVTASLSGKQNNNYLANSNHNLGIGPQIVEPDTFGVPKFMGMPKGTSQYSSTTLFTKNLRLMINKSMSKYPISGIMSPKIPTNEKLEFYLNNFIKNFLSHFPFIHASKLKELEIMAMTANEDPLNESARVCMPLLVATIGALLANDKNGSEHLYEASRRAIHIYLESRKNLVSEASSSGLQNSVHPLWLIQSLTLSVIYGLFSDNENNVYIVIRQLNALNSLVKTSVKSNRETYFLVYGFDSSSQLRHDFSPETRFEGVINTQSQTRIVLMIFRLTNFILMMYNVPLTLSLNDLGNIACPNIYEEFLWRFYDYNAFATYLRSIDSPNNLDFYLYKDENNTIVLKDLLMRLMANDFGPGVVTKLSNLSKFGFTTLVQAIFEVKQYEEMKNLDVGIILDNAALFIDSAKTNVATRFPTQPHIDFEKLDCAMLINFVKICSIINFKLVKEQSWLRNPDELTKNYHKFLIQVDRLSDFDFVKLIDCCITIIKILLFRTDDAELQFSNGKEEIFLTELSSFSSSNGCLSPMKVMVSDSLRHQYNTCANFEKAISWKVFDEIDSSKNSLNSQVLFHIFTILSLFAVHLAKRNNPNTELGRTSNGNYTKQLNQRFVIVMSLMFKIERFLRTLPHTSRQDDDLASLYMFLSGMEDILGSNGFDGNESTEAGNLLDPNRFFSYKLDKSLYILKIGELMLKYFYDTNIKICIFKKLSDSLSQMRKFLIEGESMILQ